MAKNTGRGTVPDSPLFSKQRERGGSFGKPESKWSVAEITACIAIVIFLVGIVGIMVMI